jgi:hypothetical protein
VYKGSLPSYLDSSSLNSPCSTFCVLTIFSLAPYKAGSGSTALYYLKVTGSAGPLRGS